MLLMLVGKVTYLKVLYITFTGEDLLPEMLQTGQESDGSVFAVDLSNLMQIQIFNFEGLECQMWMLKHLLENVTSLNEMRVEVRTVLVEDGQPSLTTAMNFLEMKSHFAVNLVSEAIGLFTVGSIIFTGDASFLSRLDMQVESVNGE